MTATILLLSLNIGWGKVIIIAIWTIVLIKLIQNAAKKKVGIKQEQFDAWHSDYKNWKAGVFYYNPKDPRILPPKRVSWLGWTVNFANPFSLLAIVAILALLFTLLGSLQT